MFTLSKATGGETAAQQQHDQKQHRAQETLFSGYDAGWALLFSMRRLLWMDFMNAVLIILCKSSNIEPLGRGVL